MNLLGGQSWQKTNSQLTRRNEEDNGSGGDGDNDYYDDDDDDDDDGSSSSRKNRVKVRQRTPCGVLAGRGKGRRGTKRLLRSPSRPPTSQQ
ncbi:hypothetical protein M0804_012565 [Polistes exclamans]|nr:hypothetical protein M0804_012565 [Polistes exclamans]